MSVLYLIIPITLVMATIAVVAYYWAVSTGQMDDLDSPPNRMMTDDDDA